MLQYEMKAATAYAEALRQRFRTGEISLQELSRAEEDLRLNEDKLLEDRLERRLSWLEIAFEVGIAPRPETPTLEQGRISDTEGDLPKPPV